jgi:hypothetical protein
VVPPKPVPRPPVVKTPAPTPRPPVVTPGPRPRPPVILPPATKRVELVGRNLVGLAGPPDVRLDGRPLAVAEADESRLVVELPDDVPAAGTLEVDHGDGDVATYELAAADPWAPQGA